MGIFISKLFHNIGELINSQRNVRILLLGLDNAGKTTILYKFRLGENVSTIPTIGFNVEEVTYKRLKFTMWDVGGQHRIRPLWRHYFEGTTCLIYVVDSADRERMDEAREELDAVLADDNMRDAAVCIFCNKQDLPGSLTTAAVADALQLRSLRQRQWYCQATCAQTGDGLFEGLEWIAGQVVRSK